MNKLIDSELCKLTFSWVCKMKDANKIPKLFYVIPSDIEPQYLDLYNALSSIEAAYEVGILANSNEDDEKEVLRIISKGISITQREYRDWIRKKLKSL
jgi:hypothetical protein